MGDSWSPKQLELGLLLAHAACLTDHSWLADRVKQRYQTRSGGFGRGKG